MKYLIPLIFLLISGCGRHDAPTWPEEFNPPMNEFIRYSDQAGHPTMELMWNLDIRVGDVSRAKTDVPNGTVAAYCNKPKTCDHDSNYNDCPREIVVNEKLWPNLQNTDKEQLLFHELGHCLFDFDHNNAEAEYEVNGNLYQDGTTIMAPLMIHTPVYKKYRSSYLSSFFGLPESAFQ